MWHRNCLRTGFLAFRAIIIAITGAAFAPSARAQCANGAPPPCNTPRSVARANPPLDARKWIVLPFTNIRRASDLDWVSPASVNMLSIDMSRWTDLHVVDDARVADLLFGVPVASRAQLGLAAAITIAKRAGAGRLVTGQFVKNGSQVAITAKIYETRTQALRTTVSDTASSEDAIPATFSRLAEQVLAVPPPPGTTLSGLGTKSVQAVIEYTLGLRAYNESRMDSAGVHLRRALSFDSTLALAHLKLAAVYGVYRPTGRDSALTLAMRYAINLPAREQLVVAARQLNPGRAAICDAASRLLALDSADTEGWIAMGRCHLSAAVATVDATGRIRAGQDWNAARRAYWRAFNPPTPDRRDAFQGLMDLYGPPIRRVCAVQVSAPCPPESSYWGRPVIEGDSFAVHLTRVDRFNNPARSRASAAGGRALALVANDLASIWSSANPRDLRTRAWFANWQLRLGDLAGATRELQAGAELADLQFENINRQLWALYGAELALRQMRPEGALPLLDLLVRGPITIGSSSGSFAGAMAQFQRDVPVADTAQSVRAARVAFVPVYTGVVSPDFARIMQVYAGERPSQREFILEIGTTLGFHALRNRAAPDTASAFSLFRFQAFLARGDTVNARRALTEYDAWGDAGAEDYFDAHEMFSAESHLELGDTATAWKRAEPFGRRWPGYASLNASRVGQLWDGPIDFTPAIRVSGRSWLLYADLAMSTGHLDEARRGYKMIVGMWEKGDPPVQPLVKRAKEALVKLGGM